MKYLVFTLAGHLASHGDVGAGRVRNSWLRPGRSAVLGLVAGSLGIRHEDEAAHAALSTGYGYAVRTDAMGRSLRDYHTVQHPKGVGGRNLRTRRAELQHEKVGCVPTAREYRTDALYTVALWARGGRWTLDELAAALRHPVFVPYIGRKSCPLSLPMQPQLIEADTLPAALALRPALPATIASLMPIRLDDRPELAADADGGVTASRMTTRRDVRLRHKVWGERVEHIGTLERTQP